MKYILSAVFLFTFILKSSGQGALPESFFNGKAAVFISTDPAAAPAMTWKAVADSVHNSLVKAGADPVAYFELEQVALSEAVQEEFAQAFRQRQIKNIILVTRQKSKASIHVAPFSETGTIIPTTSLYGRTESDLMEATASFATIGEGRKSQNLLVLDVPEFINVTGEESSSSSERFLPRNPLNLDVFKLGIPIEGSSAQTGLLSYFRYDNFGKSQEAILAEQAAQKSGIEQILEQEYPYAVEWLTEPRSDEELIQDRIQFLLIKVEGREADLMRSMGLEPAEGSTSRTVVKYYIKLLVRDELYIGPEWDADPDWRKALRNFLSNLKK